MFFLGFIVACHDSGPDPIDNPIPDPDPDTILIPDPDSLPVSGPYDDIIGTYQGFNYCQSNDYNMVTGAWTITYDTSAFAFEILEVIPVANDYVKLTPNTWLSFWAPEELYSQDTIPLFAYWSYTQHWLTIFRKEKKIEFHAHVGAPFGPDYSDCYYTGIK